MGRRAKWIKELGQGACGKTVLLHDDMINEYFVCKKYCPFSEDQRQDLFANFVREIKLLHQLHHRNVVRVFNYYLYPAQFTGYILMEFIEGSDIEEYLKQYPEKTNEIFLQAISGFRYLEAHRILHRDVRPHNLMVGDDGTLKIIDLGFGKRIQNSEDFGKSISLNWWCEPPEEFDKSIYDFRTEVYFVGKLFEKIIQEMEIEHFKYRAALTRMCNRNHDSRVQSFFDIEKEIQSDRFFEIDFGEEEVESYRNFADCMAHHISKMEHGVKYYDDFERIQTQLENVYRSFMLEEHAPDCASIIRCFISGNYYYMKLRFPVSAVKNFLRLLQSMTQEKKRIIFANLHSRFDAISRYTNLGTDDDIPF
ncbi:MAG: protein kinase family protein [Thermodesulfobacteriota bacterium]|nr:protein kinase family protein [Thermodesulfobacteriota bacterium]